MSFEAEGELAIEVRGLTKRFRLFQRQIHRIAELFSLGRRRYHKAFTALDNVTFSVRKGEAVGIIGRNGSGKSTLLQMICGTLTPTEGEVRVHGRVAALLELGAGFNPDFTGRENVYLNAALYGLTKSDVDERFEKIVEFADIGEFIEQPVKTYSSGMFVRLAFAVIAHVDADILVIDEALAVGDVAFGQKCMRFLRAFRENGTILFVSHDTAAVIGLCDQAVWLDGGQLKAVGRAKDVCELYFGHVFGDKKIDATVLESEEESDGQTRTLVPPEDWIDGRQPWVNATNLRNDLELFVFEPNSGGDFGFGGARIEDVRFTDPAGRPYRWILGGEETILTVEVKAFVDLDRPIIGFYVKDRLGQALFGDNTFLTTLTEDGGCKVSVKAGETFTATFRFPMPVLPKGSYVIAVAVADGTQEDHVQHHWMHDALIFKSHSSHTVSGLVGIPMLDVSLSTAHGKPID
ncbi:lipopolysaccharide transport system ATP-binding protein [Rhizobium rosettiformans]|uniref:ABC transporter ATP-binding protein n=2 Tax=Rhizobium rosettiformans TaxID=1368430 RepID=A0A4S8PK42_9HYPH|nr:ABC transporter ATP-binding protein [Rhizobium rosettiformans]MBB5278495.1 lipopolysaccharide transport system ATP-binding protein [Rhizobium rosettiformans]THV31088.1 ABC transporter ATP-binding protein [Rhizobium rosettiformans W3]